MEPNKRLAAFTHLKKSSTCAPTHVRILMRVFSNILSCSLIYFFFVVAEILFSHKPIDAQIIIIFVLFLHCFDLVPFSHPSVLFISFA